MTLTLRGSSYQALTRRASDRRMSVAEYLRKAIDRVYGTPTRDATGREPIEPREDRIAPGLELRAF